MIDQTGRLELQYHLADLKKIITFRYAQIYLSRWLKPLLGSALIARLSETLPLTGYCLSTLSRINSWSVYVS